MTFKFKKWKCVEVVSYELQLFAIRIIMRQGILPYFGRKFEVYQI